MLGIIFIYFVGKSFYTLAETYNKNAWGYAIAGVLSYYGGGFIGGILIAIGMELVNPGSINEDNETALGLLAIPLGLLTVWGLYKYTEKRFKKERTPDDLGINSTILDDNLMK